MCSFSNFRFDAHRKKKMEIFSGWKTQFSGGPFKSNQKRFISSVKCCRSIKNWRRFNLCSRNSFSVLKNVDASRMSWREDVKMCAMNEINGKCSLFWHLLIRFVLHVCKWTLYCIWTMAKMWMIFFIWKTRKKRRMFHSPDENWKCSTKQAIWSCHCKHNKHF